MTDSMSDQIKVGEISPFFIFLIFIKKIYNMKNKFVLTEEESKRILSLHKEKINQERNVVSENTNTKIVLTEAVWDRVRNKISECKYNKEKATMKNSALNKLASNIKDWPSDVQWSMDFTDRSAILGRSKKAAKWVAQQIYATKNKGNFCKLIDIYNKSYADDNFFEDFDSAFDGDASFSILSAAVNKVMDTKGGEVPPTPSPTPSKQGCPSIVKSFTDAGYSQITKERFDELSTDNTKTRNYKYCPVTKKNLYFAKPKQGSSGGTGVNVRGGGNVGNNQTFTFDYNQILAAINQKCPGGGGGSTTPEDQDIVNPFGQGAEQGQPQPQVIKVTDEIYAGLK
jgi:hypothetical protein